MGHITTRSFGFHWTDASADKAEPRAGASWLQRVLATIVARLEADTPPLATAMAYSHAYRALPVPN